MILHAMIVIPRETAELIFSNYLRLDVANMKDDDTIPYVKGSVLDTKLIIEDGGTHGSHMIEPYMVKGSEVSIHYKKLASGTIVIYRRFIISSEVQAEKGIVCRIKFGGILHLHLK